MSPPVSSPTGSLHPIRNAPMLREVSHDEADTADTKSTMKKKLRYAILGILTVGILIQFIPVERTNPPVIADFAGPRDVKAIFQKSCYDCHSNETEWPWYSYVAPVSWLVSHDVKEGREHLNFSEWDQHADDPELREEIFEEIDEGEMPMSIYLVLHPDAKLDQIDHEKIKVWAETASD